MTPRTITILAAIAASVGAFLGAAVAEGAGAETVFTLREPLGQDWRDDVVSFRLPPGQTPTAEPSQLLGPDGSSVPFQIDDRGSGRVISFLAALPAYGESSYRLAPGAAAPAENPFSIERTATSIRVTNGLAGIEIPTGDGDASGGPIGRIRLASGRWVGSGRLTGIPPLENHEATVTAAGPVFAEVTWRGRFAGGGEWRFAVRLVAGAPVLLFSESFAFAPDATWDVAFGDDWRPDRLTMMPGTGPAPYATTSIPADDSPAARIGPWIQWWDARHGTFCGLSQGDGTTVPDDMLLLAASDVASWARGGDGTHDDAPARFLTVRGPRDGGVAITLPLMGPGRTWMLASLTTADATAAVGGIAPFHALYNRWLETPLDAVKEMTLAWKRGGVASHPVLGIGRERLIEVLRSKPVDDILSAAVDPPSAAARRTLWPRLLAGGGGDLSPETTAVKARIEERLDAMIAVFRRGNRGFPAAMYGTMIPRVDIPDVLPVLDLALGAGVFTPDEQERVYTKLAFIAHELASPDYVSPERSLAGNPNMVTSWSTAMVLLAAMMPDHPHAADWYRQGMARLDAMLDDWQGPNGAWLEAPHYHIQALDPILAAKLAAANAGLATVALDERLLRTGLFLARISTPPDPELGNFRHLPPLGNTYRRETSMLFGALAALAAAKHPDEAAELQWVWQEQGRRRRAALGGIFLMNFHAEELLRPEWSPPPPAWKSESFPGFGAVLRGGFARPRETYLVHHQGDVAREHYDDDQGSFEFWGKGRPLCLDWGYRGRMAAALHNRVGIGGIGSVTSFASEPALDHLVGRQGAWTRQVVMVRDADPLGPNYVVLRDRIEGSEAADWRVWCRTAPEAIAEPVPAAGILERSLDRAALPSAVVIDGGVVRFTGADDVDLDVWLGVAGSDPVADARFVHAAVLTVGGALDGGWSGWDEDRLDQVGLVVPMKAGTTIVTVLYPRLRGREQPAVFSALADDRGVRVDGAWGTDLVFLADEPFDYTGDRISFHGTVGLVQRRGGTSTLSLAGAGTISDGTRTVTREAAVGGP